MSSADRRWLEVRLRLPESDADRDMAAFVLTSVGGRAVEERGGWLVSHLEEPDDPPALEARVRATIGEWLLGPTEVEFRWQRHEDWAEAWKRGLDTRRITPRLTVTPTWLPVQPSGDERVLVLDPGMAFGTAEHGTTRGCLRLLDRAVMPGQRLLDVGAGSGILSIAAALLGAASVRAIEGDPLATEAVLENVERNGVRDAVFLDVRWADSEYLAAQAPVDGIVANIESGVLRPLLDGFRTALGSGGGWLVLSGILGEEWPAMSTAAEAAGFHLVDLDVDGEWRAAWFTTIR